MVVTSPFLAGNKAKASLAVIMVFLLTLMVLLFGAVVADAQDPDPDPDPVYYYPDASSNVGDIVLNPATDQQTVVVELILDPVEAGPNPQVSFVVIDDSGADGKNVVLVKSVGETIYDQSTPARAMLIDSISEGRVTVSASGNTFDFESVLQYADYQTSFSAAETPPVLPPDDLESISNTKYEVVRGGCNGSNGSIGVFFWPPTNGG